MVIEAFCYLYRRLGSNSEPSTRPRDSHYNVDYSIDNTRLSQGTLDVETSNLGKQPLSEQILNSYMEKVHLQTSEQVKNASKARSRSRLPRKNSTKQRKEPSLDTIEKPSRQRKQSVVKKVTSEKLSRRKRSAAISTIEENQTRDRCKIFSLQNFVTALNFLKYFKPSKVQRKHQGKIRENLEFESAQKKKFLYKCLLKHQEMMV